MNTEFSRYLFSKNLSKNTIAAYSFSEKQFSKQFPGKITKKNLQSYKLFLIEHYKAKTVNLRIRGINAYIEFTGKKNLRLTTVKIQSSNFLENVISDADYQYLKNKLKHDNTFWYFVVRFLAATGARVSELLQIKAEHIYLGYLDLYSKGGKIRRIYIP